MARRLSTFETVNKYPISGTVSGTTFTLTLADGSEVAMDLAPLSGTADGVSVSSGAVVGNDLSLTMSDSSVVTVDVSSLVGGGGGGTNAGSFSNWVDPAPAVCQVAATPIAANGVSYVAGDAFIYVAHLSTTVYVMPCIALRSFTFNAIKGAGGHNLLGDVFLNSRMTMNQVIDDFDIDATAVDMSMVGRSLLIRTITFNGDVNALLGGTTTAGTPRTLSQFDGIIPIPWLYNDAIAAGACVRMSTDYRGFMRPTILLEADYTVNVDSKSDARWARMTSLGLGECLGDALGGGNAGPFVFAGESIEIPEALEFFAVAPNVGDPVYLDNTVSLGGGGMDVNFLRTTPVDANTVRIGTWQAGNILDVAFS